jgi:hypothetical protein
MYVSPYSPFRARTWQNGKDHYFTFWTCSIMTDRKEASSHPLLEKKRLIAEIAVAEVLNLLKAMWDSPTLMMGKSMKILSTSGSTDSFK